MTGPTRKFTTDVSLEKEVNFGSDAHLDLHLQKRAVLHSLLCKNWRHL